MSGSELLAERPSLGVAVLTLNRPDKRNALTLSLKHEIARQLGLLASDPEVRVVILTGGPKVFAGGTDILELSALSPGDHDRLSSDVLWRALDGYPKPVIAAVNGAALGGGCELALHADLIIAGEGARFGQPEIRVGIMPGAGGSQRLLRAIGRYQTMRLVLLGEPVDAAEALRMGMVSEVVRDEDVLSRAIETASKLAAMPPLAISAIRSVVAAGEEAPLSVALALERKAFQLLFGTDDQKEGMAAFLEKRPPHFTGH